jgi:hypothetical protein
MFLIAQICHHQTTVVEPRRQTTVVEPPLSKPFSRCRSPALQLGSSLSQTWAVRHQTTSRRKAIDLFRQYKVLVHNNKGEMVTPPHKDSDRSLFSATSAPARTRFSTLNNEPRPRQMWDNSLCLIRLLFFG